MTNAMKTITDVELRRVVKRFGVRKTRQWFLDGAGLPERIMSRAEWCQMHGSFHGYKNYVAEAQAELIISELPKVPTWLISVKMLQCAREAAR